MQEKIIILDFGSQTTQLIGRRVRELDTYCEFVVNILYWEFAMAHSLCRILTVGK